MVWSSCSREDTQNHTTGGRRADPQPTEPAPQGHTTTGGGGRDRPPSLPPLPPPRVEEEREGKGPYHPSPPRGGEGTVALGPVRFHPVEAIPSAPEEGTVGSAQWIIYDFSCATLSFYVGETKQNDITNLSSCSSSFHCFASLYPQLLSIDWISEENNRTNTINCSEPLSESTRASTLGWRR